jgi:hypothetical protein
MKKCPKKRGHTVADYRALVAKIRARIPNVSLATDIIVGGHGDGYRLQMNIDNSTNLGRQVFLEGGMNDERIYYLSPNNQTGRDAPSSSVNLQSAITTWAAGKVGPGIPL